MTRLRAVRVALLGAALVATALGGAPVASGAAPRPFGHPCVAQSGVRFCPAATLEQRVPSFDGVPIDVDVTLPPTGGGPFPTIVLLHGYPGTKTAYEVAPGAPAGSFSNVALARAGYAVVTTSARGFGASCGVPASRTPACARGWIHLADQRYEARDTQTLLGRLVDEGVAKASALGVSGGSYGGGQSLELAFLKDRVRKADGSFARWRSPRGTRLSIAAAYPVIPWSDLASALVPNGRESAFAVPAGVELLSYLNALYLGGAAVGYTAPKGADPGADLGTWTDVLNAGEPYGSRVRSILTTLSKYHGAMSLARAGDTPAPLMMLSGWTDDLFPPIQTLRVYDALRKRDPAAPVWLQLDDFGHSRGGSHAADQSALTAQALDFFATYLKGAKGRLPKRGSVLAFGQSCPNLTPRGLGPYRASSYDALSRAVLRLAAGGTQTVTSDGGDPALAMALNPKASQTGLGGNPCATFPLPASAAPGTAVMTKPVGKAFTYLGRGRISATVDTTGPYGQLNARLWDVAAGGQTLVDRSVYRLTPDQRGAIAFYLHGNGYRFAAGHTLKLELLGKDFPTRRSSNGHFAVRVSDLTVKLPVR